jgi:NhaP-type Na+/H+ or K+/H+ antiporter
LLGYLIIAGCLAGYCMIANRMSETVFTAPMVFLGLGALVSEGAILPVAGTEETLHIVAEVTLIILLFLDAAKIDQKALVRHRVWPARMLGIGLPLAFVFGTVLGMFALPGWPLAAVALVAAILVPTDAALGQPVVSNPAVPERARRALTVESGLNDGLALPLVLLMASLAASSASAPSEGWLIFGIKQVTLGPLVGVALGLAGGWILLWAQRTGSTSEVYEGIGTLALAACAYLSATLIGGNGFIAAFVAGLGFGAVVRGQCTFVLEFTEGEGQLLSWAAFFLLGAVLVPEAVAHLTVEMIVFILASLFLVRPLAVWLSLVGTDASPTTRLFFGWFGPRGLATALFALVVVAQLDDALGETVLHLAVNAVWISAVLHGLTAAAGARLYAARMDVPPAKAGSRPTGHATDPGQAQARQRGEGPPR